MPIAIFKFNISKQCTPPPREENILPITGEKKIIAVVPIPPVTVDYTSDANRLFLQHKIASVEHRKIPTSLNLYGIGPTGTDQAQHFIDDLQICTPK